MNPETTTLAPLNLTVEVVELRSSAGSGFLEDSVEAVDGSSCCCTCCCGVEEQADTQTALAA
jgi:hypothetical protein